MRKSLIVLLFAAAAATASPLTFTLDPAGGGITGGPGDTIGWGFTLVNDTNSWISVTSSALTFETNPSLGTYTDFIGLQGGPLPSFALAPSTQWTQAFDAAGGFGAGSYSIAADAALAAVDSGSLLVNYDLFNGDPSNGGLQTGSDSISALFSVTIGASSGGPSTPEPATSALAALAALGLLVLARSRNPGRTGRP
jgi:hypothetical protein